MGLFGNRQNTNSSLSLIASQCSVVGEFDLEGDIQFDGKGEGTILNARNVVISSTGHFKGDIRAEHITINGLVEGTCIAKEVNILCKGKMKGRIESEHLTIQKGGCLMGENILKEEPALKVINEDANQSNKKTAQEQKKTQATA